MTGEDLREIIRSKWGYCYDVQIRKTPSKIYVQIMWKYLEQASFPLSESDYLERLDAIATYLEGMNCREQVESFILTTNEKPRLGKAVSIPLELGGRGAEWML
jgi:hypothetical protein